MCLILIVKLNNNYKKTKNTRKNKIVKYYPAVYFTAYNILLTKYMIIQFNQMINDQK